MLGQLYNKIYDYNLILCKPDKTQITDIVYSSLQYNQKFAEYNELTFGVQYKTEEQYDTNIIPYVEDLLINNGVWNEDIYWTEMVENDGRNNYVYNLLKAGYLVLLQVVEESDEGIEVIKEEFYSISEPQFSYSDGVFKAQVSCVPQHQLLFNKNLLRGFDDTVMKLSTGNTTTGLLDYIIANKLYNTWSVLHIDPELNVDHVWNFDKSTLTDVFKTIEHDLNCILIFDNVLNTISAYKPSSTELGQDTGLILSDTNYIKSLDNNKKLNELITRLYAYGKDDTVINKYNITGQSYIENMDYLVNNGYFSDKQYIIEDYNAQTLKLKLNTVKGLVNNKYIQISKSNTPILSTVTITNININGHILIKNNNQKCKQIHGGAMRFK